MHLCNPEAKNLENKKIFPHVFSNSLPLFFISQQQIQYLILMLRPFSSRYLVL